jgi:hypothetical protein
MADQRIDQLNAETTPAAADVLPVFSIAGSDTKKITVKNLVQVGAGLVDDASIPAAKVNFTAGINGGNLTNSTVTAAKLDTSTIPVSGGVTVNTSTLQGTTAGSTNLQLVVPTSPIVRNESTGSLEHAVSGATAGTYTKVTVDTKGHVTVGATLAGADVPVATSAVVGGVSIPAAGGLALTGGGALSHSNSVAGGASTRSGITYDLQGHITSTAALVAADMPIATTAALGAVIAGTGLAVDGNGILSTSVATTSDLGGIKIGSEFGLNGSNQLLLATQANVAGGTAYPKVTVNSKGVVTAGATLDAADIPNLAASKITSGSLDIARIAANTITGAKLANTSTALFGDTQPTAEYTGQLYFNSLSRDIYIWDSNVWQPIGISVGEIVFAGTFDASAGGGTGHVASVTAEGTAIGLVQGSPLPAAANANNRYYLVVSEGGTITSGNAPNVALAPPDIVLSTGLIWTEIDVSQTFTSVSASQVAFTPEGTIAANNVQAAIEEVNNEKLALAGGTMTGNLEIGTAGSLSFEGSTANNFETTVAVVDPTAARTITLPNITGTVVTTGDTGTVTSTMLLDGTIVNADINASAAIVDTKLATIATAGKVSNSATTAASANTASAIVARDASGNFTAGTITAALTGTASGNLVSGGALGTPSSGTLTNCTFPTLNQNTTGNAATVTTNANLTGDVTSVGNATAIAAGVIVNADINASAAIEGSKIVAATTSVVGAVQLSDSTSTTSSVLAATPTAVKAAYDQANTKASLSTAQTFTAAQRGTVSALGTVSAGTTTLDLATANNFSLTLPAGGSVTLGNPSNQTAGQSGVITITQNGTTAATVPYGGNWKFQGGAPTVSTTLSSVNVIAYYVESASRITAQLLTNTVS